MENKMKDFLKCGAAGWCMEIIFTSLVSLASGDRRLVGKTSLFMFPIYGMGPFWALSAGVWTGIFSGREKRIRQTGSCAMD